MSIEWKEPPPSRQRKVEVVADQLRSRPGEWALIEKDTEVWIAAWWAPLYNSPYYEVKTVKKDDRLFGKRDIYARCPLS